MAMNRFAYASASTIEEALEALDEERRPLAGGTDLIAMMKEELVAPTALVDLKRIPGLDQLREEEDGLHIGATVSLSDLVRDPIVGAREEFAVLYQALLQTASPQIRHMATVGGNLLQRPRCWYFRNKLTFCLRKGGQRCFAFRGENKYHAILGGGPCYIVHPSDPAVALLALGASVTLLRPNGTRTVPIDDLYLLPREDRHNEAGLASNELLTEVFIPAPKEGSRGTYIKVAEHGSRDFAMLSVAVQLVLAGESVERARIALGGVAPVPWHAADAAQALVGNPLTDDVIKETAQAATSGARPLAQNAYKIDLAHGLVRQALRSLR